jgi:hypothetical protein
MSSPLLDEELLDAARLYSDTGSFLAAAFADGLGHLVPPSSWLALAPPPNCPPSLPWQPGSAEDDRSSEASRVLAPSVSRVVSLLADGDGPGATSPTSDATVHFPAAPLIVFELEDSLASRGLRGDENADALARCFGGTRRVAILDAALSALSDAGASLAIFSRRSRSETESVLSAPTVHLLRHFESLLCADDLPQGDKADLIRRRLLEPRGQAARSLCLVDSRPDGLKRAAALLPGCKALLTRTGGFGPSECRELAEWVSEGHRTVYRSDLPSPDLLYSKPTGWNGHVYSCCGDHSPHSPLPGDVCGLVLSRSSPSWELP